MCCFNSPSHLIFIAILAGSSDCPHFAGEVTEAPKEEEACPVHSANACWCQILISKPRFCSWHHTTSHTMANRNQESKKFVRGWKLIRMFGSAEDWWKLWALGASVLCTPQCIGCYEQWAQQVFPPSHFLWSCLPTLFPIIFTPRDCLVSYAKL